MMTSSGILVMPGNCNAPTIEDIALSLSREHRFGGQAAETWTVLQHLLAAESLASGVAKPGRVPFFALLHDAHEAITRDVPGTWKTAAATAQQDELDLRIWKSLNVDPPTVEERAAVKAVDTRLLLAEARVFGPLGCYEVIFTDIGRGADAEAIATVRSVQAAWTPERARDVFTSRVHGWLDVFHPTSLNDPF